jgi:transcriptional regulator GlxA family with amidase domain
VVQFPPTLLGQGPESGLLAGILERSRLGLAGPPSAAGLVRAVHQAGDPLLRLGRLLEAIANAATWRPISPTPPRRRRRDPRLDRAVTWLHLHAGEPIELGQLAARVGMAPPALSRSFRAAFGVTAIEYLARLRVGLCCRDLVDSDDEVAAVAFANGFGNLVSFHRWFRRITGTTPDRWRNSIDGADGAGG